MPERAPRAPAPPLATTRRAEARPAPRRSHPSRHAAWFATIAGLLAAAGACAERPDPAPIPVVDLIKQIGHAEKRPLNGVFQIAEHTFGGRSRASIVVPVPSRIIWISALPRRARVSLAAGIPESGGGSAVNVRIGISDDRIYEALSERIITGRDALERGWTPLGADLSRYAGPKFSLFYHPDGRRWHIIVSVDAVAGDVTTAYLGEPAIEAGAAAAKRFFKDHALASSVAR